ncbi:hypothetical protein PQH03_11390 [Ralstonia insidiosa]|jgi:hypothetical protein|uniref:hypothetical protein n=1 Tax=Ralstonia TaxID=48736 RepID=UPI000664B557|nr:hypothetical protein [Ralstonia insidiosa]KMW45966.1 membrane protein [Ralstonia sp. MD27]MBX3775444.1 hypothetical protein [Ralstonia pickettii]NOZ17072.1 hypothetical protein [Betaproteobacteria bacterium]MBA9858733.1 hypothetical protein [Ralstonia insidiosa]MBA9873155.1 hypothetical protein [Ralstonia insidiosa]
MPLPFTTSLQRAAIVAAAAAVFAGCASTGASRFDVDSFLTAPDTVLSEVLVNKDFLRATKLPDAECAALVKGHAAQVVALPNPEDPRIPEAASRKPFVIEPPGSESVWLLLRGTVGVQSCHGPLPAKEFMGLVQRASN